MQFQLIPPKILIKRNYGYIRYYYFFHKTFISAITSGHTVVRREIQPDPRFAASDVPLVCTINRKNSLKPI